MRQNVTSSSDMIKANIAFSSLLSNLPYVCLSHKAIQKYADIVVATWKSVVKVQGYEYFKRAYMAQSLIKPSFFYILFMCLHLIFYR